MRVSGLSVFKIAFILALGVYGLWGAFDIRRLWLLEGANLLFHEAGHLFFGVLGEWMGMAGGTLLQLLIPAAIAVAFFIKDQKYSASVILFWFGENFLGISKYIQDARAQSLPLVGGEIHDWGYLLGKLNLLEYDAVIGFIAWASGILIISFSMISGIYFSERSR